MDDQRLMKVLLEDPRGSLFLKNFHLIRALCEYDSFRENFCKEESVKDVFCERDTCYLFRDSRFAHFFVYNEPFRNKFCSKLEFRKKLLDSVSTGQGIFETQSLSTEELNRYFSGLYEREKGVRILHSSSIFHTLKMNPDFLNIFFKASVSGICVSMDCVALSN